MWCFLIRRYRGRGSTLSEFETFPLTTTQRTWERFVSDRFECVAEWGGKSTIALAPRLFALFLTSVALTHEQVFKLYDTKVLTLTPTFAGKR